jgi:hypothetical protein
MKGQNNLYAVYANCAYDNFILDVCFTVHLVNKYFTV